MARLKLGVQVSGRGSNLQALIDACRDSSFPAEIVLVISNVPGVQGLERAEKAGIPTIMIPHKEFPTREAFDEAIDAAHRKAGVELVCLAGFMRVISAWFVNRWKGRLINIHPSLLPAYKGLHTHREVLKAGEAYTGCTVHYVDEGVDTGAIILQALVPIEPGDTEESLAARVLKEEHRLYPEAVKMIATNKIRFENGKVLGAVALMLFSMLFAQPALAEVTHDTEKKLREEFVIPAASVACKTSADCVVVNLPCGPTIGVRAGHKEEARELICQHRDCSGACNASAVMTPFAICTDGECWADYQNR